MDGLDVNQMFTAALGLTTPWQVASVAFDPGAGRLELGLDFPREARFACPESGCAEQECPVHDRLEKTWRHLDFFEHQAYLVACQEDGTVVARFLPPSWDHLFSQSWDRPACCAGASFGSLFDHRVSVLGVEVNRDGFQGGQRG